MNNIQINAIDPYIVQYHNLDAYEYLVKAEEELYYKDLLNQQEEYDTNSSRNSNICTNNSGLNLVL